jgi:hypothetical protein
MKHARKTALAASAFTCAALLSFGWSEQGGISLSIESAQARVGRPLTPVSVAGVARRQTRRAVYGAGVVGAGAAAVGTAAAIAGGPYYGGSVRGARAAYYGGYPSAPAWGGVSSSDREMYIRNLHDSGYNPKNNFNASGNIQG